MKKLDPTKDPSAQFVRNSVTTSGEYIPPLANNINALFELVFLRYGYELIAQTLATMVLDNGLAPEGSEEHELWHRLHDTMSAKCEEPEVKAKISDALRRLQGCSD
jgi:hypothetical protein